jgi:hypothetical protein
MFAAGRGMFLNGGCLYLVTASTLLGAPAAGGTAVPLTGVNVDGLGGMAVDGSGIYWSEMGAPPGRMVGLGR